MHYDLPISELRLKRFVRLPVAKKTIQNDPEKSAKINCTGSFHWAHPLILETNLFEVNPNPVWISDWNVIRKPILRFRSLADTKPQFRRLLKRVERSFWFLLVRSVVYLLIMLNSFADSCLWIFFRSDLNFRTERWAFRMTNRTQPDPYLRANIEVD